MRFAMRIRLLSLREEGGFFKWGEHIEQTTDFDDTLVIDVRVDDTTPAAWAKWASSLGSLLRDYQPDGDPLTDQESQPGVWVARISFPQSGAFLGPEAAVRLKCTSIGDAD